LVALKGLVLRQPILRGVRQAYLLLPSSSRRRLLLLVAANMTTAFLDLIGVALVGLLSLQLVTLVQDEGAATGSTLPIPEFVGELGGGGVRGLVVLGVAACAFLLAKSVIASSLTWQTLMFLARKQAIVSETMTDELFRLPLSQIERRTSQETTFALLQGVTSAIVGLLGAGSLALAEIALLVLLGIGLFLLSPWVTIAAVVFFALLAMFMHVVLGSWSGKTGMRMATANYGFVQSAQEGISTYRELTVSGRMDELRRRLSLLVEQSSKSYSTQVFILSMPKYVYETALLVGALALGGIQFATQTPEQAVAIVSVFLAAGSRIMPSMLRLQNYMVSMRSANGMAASTFDLAAFLAEQSAPATAKVAERRPVGSSGFIPSIQLATVSARYPGSTDCALVGVSLTVEHGQTVAIVGPTGSGKSTLADVILGILPTESGDVRISGLPPETALKVFPGEVGYVPQSVALVVGSVRENVALWVPGREIDDARVRDALATVQLDHLLDEERDGIETQVGERGSRLSGGQRQRLGLARALYSRPSLLVLDEATSQLDAVTEAAISSTLSRLRGHATMLVIAHRLATVRDADSVIYLERGRIVARGTFEEVRLTVPSFDESARLLGL
jgi:ABC-type multidrug transport system fused ATPase/permease subunit